MKKNFNGSPKDEVESRPYNSVEVYNQVKNIAIVLEKHQKKETIEKTFGRNNIYYLIFYICVNLMYDII